MTTPRTARDPDLVQDLGPHAGLLRIYRHHATESPSAALDARILAMAAAATDPPLRVSALRPWMRYAASMTAVVLAAGIGWRLLDTQRPELASTQRDTRERPVSAMPAPSPAPAAVHAEAARAMGGAPAVTVSGRAADEIPAHAAAPRLDAARAAAEPTLRSAPAAATPPPAPAQLGETLPAPAPSAFAERSQAAPAPAPPAAGSAPRATTSPEATPQPTWNAAPKAVQRESRLAAQEAVAEKVAESAPASAPIATDALSKRQRSPLDPQAWLDDVRALLQSGHVEEARVSLREWRRRYPQHPLPDDLAALLEASPAPAPH